MGEVEIGSQKFPAIVDTNKLSKNYLCNGTPAKETLIFQALGITNAVFNFTS